MTAFSPREGFRGSSRRSMAELKTRNRVKNGTRRSPDLAIPNDAKGRSMPFVRSMLPLLCKVCCPALSRMYRL